MSLQFRPRYCPRKSSGISSWKQSLLVCSSSRLIAHQGSRASLRLSWMQSYTYVFPLENGHNQAIHASCQDASCLQMPWVIAGKICFCVCISWYLSGWSLLKSEIFYWNVDGIGIHPEDASQAYGGCKDWYSWIQGGLEPCLAHASDARWVLGVLSSGTDQGLAKVALPYRRCCCRAAFLG